MKNLRFSSRPREKVRRQGPPGSTTAQPCGQLFVPTRKAYSVNTNPKCDTPLKTEIGATQLCSVTANRAVEITVLLREQKPYPVLFSCRRKSYPVQYEHDMEPEDIAQSFRTLRKCQNKFDCLIFEMFFIQELKPTLS